MRTFVTIIFSVLITTLSGTADKGDQIRVAVTADIIKHPDTARAKSYFLRELDQIKRVIVVSSEESTDYLFHLTSSQNGGIIVINIFTGIGRTFLQTAWFTYHTEEQLKSGIQMQVAAGDGSFFTTKPTSHSCFGVITRIIDGDTVDFSAAPSYTTSRIRLAGIDAPEKEQPFYQEATSYLENYKGVPIRIDTNGRDIYGRVLGELWCREPKQNNQYSINSALVMNGLAKNWERGGPYKTEEAAARNARVGIWTNAQPKDFFDDVAESTPEQ